MACAMVACAWIAAADAAWALGSVEPIGSGPYPVGCSDVSQQFGPATSDEDRAVYWEGASVGGEAHYVTQLLAQPNGAFAYDVSVPEQRDLFATFAGQSVPYVAIVCYPTSDANTRPDYFYDAALTEFVPRMQRAGEAPLWADANTRYPVVLYSHGLGGSPLSGEYLQTIAMLASYGYVVVAPFYGDGRFSELSFDSVTELARYLLEGGFSAAVELQAVRPLSLSAALDALLADPNYREHVDAERVAGLGISLGAESLLLFSGARLTSEWLPRLQSAQVMSDSRLKAIAGYIPYFGQRLLPAFGDNQDGLDGMTVPFLGIGGTADDIAPLLLTEQGVNRMTGARYVVAFDGLTHALHASDLPDIYTWVLTFFDAYLNGSQVALGKIARTNEVAGGATDSVRIAHTPLPAPAAAQSSFTFADGQLPADSAQVSAEGSMSSAVLKVSLDISELSRQLAAADPAGVAGNVYVLALVRGEALDSAEAAWYVKLAQGWAPLEGSIGAYLANAAAQGATAVVDVVDGMDIRLLAGTEIYVGFGASDIEALGAGRYRGVYRIP